LPDFRTETVMLCFLSRQGFLEMALAFFLKALILSRKGSATLSL